jgi:hypothetical protein
LQKAVRWLPEYTGSKLEIVVVTPLSIPDSAGKALQKKGIRITEVEYEFPDPLPGSALSHR